MSEQYGNLLYRHALQQQLDREGVAKSVDTAVRNVCLLKHDLERAFPNLDCARGQAPAVPEEVLLVIARRSLQCVDGFRRQRHPDGRASFLCIEKELVA